eukprot:gene27131-35639_t
MLYYVPKWNLNFIWYLNAGFIGFVCYSIVELSSGYWADRCKSKLGRRKPFVLAGSFLKCIACISLCNPPRDELSSTGITAWYLLLFSLGSTGSGLSANPLTSWLMESSISSSDYRKISTLPVTIGNFCGALIGFGSLQVSPTASTIGVAIFAVSVILMVLFVPNELHRKTDKLPPIVPSLRIAAQTQEFRSIFFNRVLIGSATQIFTSSASLLLLIGFSNIHTQKDFVFYSIAMGISSGTLGVVIVVIFNWYLLMVDKLTVYLRLTIVVTLASVIGFFATLSSSLYCFILYYLTNMTIGILYHPIIVIEGFMLRDLIIFDTYSTGLNRENTYVTAITLPSSVLISFFGSVPLCILTLTGFHQQFPANGSAKEDDQITSLYTWNDGSLWILRCFGTLSVTVLAFYSYQIIKDHSITQSIADKINNLLRERELAHSAAVSCEDQGKGGDLEVRRSEEIQADVELVQFSDARTDTIHDSAGIASDGAIRSSEDSTSLSIDTRMLLLHLTSEELAQLVSPPLPSSTRTAVLTGIHRQSMFTVIVGSLTLAFMLVVCALDAVYAMGGFSTLLLSLSLLLLAFIIYEFLRAMAFSEILEKIIHCNWTEDILQSYARIVLEEFNVVDLIKDGAILSESDISASIEVSAETMSTLLLPKQSMYEGYLQVNTADGSNSNEDSKALPRQRPKFHGAQAFIPSLKTAEKAESVDRRVGWDVFHAKSIIGG